MRIGGVQGWVWLWLASDLAGGEWDGFSGASELDWEAFHDLTGTVVGGIESL